MGHHNLIKNYKGDKHPQWKGGKIERKGYIYIYCPEHPNATKQGYVAEHVLVAEKALGKILPKGAIVHHIDENPKNNINKNLVICEGMSHHVIIHRRMKAFKECGNADWRLCGICKKYDDVKNLRIYKNSSPAHRECTNKLSLRRYHKNKEEINRLRRERYLKNKLKKQEEITK